MKPWLKILIVAAVVGLIGLGIYFVFQPQPLDTELSAPNSELPAGQLPSEETTDAENTQTDSGNSATGPGPENQQSTLAAISDREALGFWANGDDIFYLDLNGKIYRARTNEDEEVFSQSLGGPLNGLESAETGGLTLISYGAPNSPSWTIFDSRDLTYRPLTQDIKLAAWGNKTGEVVAIKELANGTRQLIILEADKLAATPKIILNDFRMENIKITSAGDESLLIQELPDSEYPGKIWKWNLKNLTWTVLRDSATNQLVKRGSASVFFVWSGGNNFEINTNSDLTEQFPVPFVTVPQKCGAENDLAFCFVPQSTSENAMDSFLKNKFFARDALYKINADSEDFEIINLDDLSGGTAIDAKNPRLAGNSLIFLNRLDKKIYQLTNFR